MTIDEKITQYDHDKLFLAYEECRSDNTAHMRKIIELQNENEKLKSEMLADMQKLLVVINKSKDDFWFMQSLLERTTNDKYLRDAVNDCIERMKFRKPMFEKSLAEFNAKYNKVEK